MKTESSEFLNTESDCVKIFKENLVFNGSRYEVKLPFRPHTDFIPDNYVVAEKRLTSLREQLTKDSNLLFEYDRIISDYLSMGIIEEVPLNQNIEPGTIHFLPHRAVIKSFILEGTLQMHMSKYDFTYHDIDLVQTFIRDFVYGRYH